VTVGDTRWCSVLDLLSNGWACASLAFVGWCVFPSLISCGFIKHLTIVIQILSNPVGFDWSWGSLWDGTTWDGPEGNPIWASTRYVDTPFTAASVGRAG